MSEYLQPGMHPDPDSLNAFIEGVLPEHERLQCLTHLAECPSCREVVYLAQEPLASGPATGPATVLSVAEKVPFWKRWLTPIPALSAATATGILVLSFWMYYHFKSVPGTAEMAAIAAPATASASAPQMEQQRVASSASAAKVKARVRMPAPPAEETAALQRGEKDTARAMDVPVAVGGTTAPAPPASPPPPASLLTPAAAAPTAAIALTGPVAAPPAAPLSPPQLALLDAASSGASPAAATQTGIAGTITDPAGGAVAGAGVNLRPLASPASRKLTSDPKGQFNVAGLEPGRYELQVTAPGFKTMTRQVNVEASQMARADSTLSVGSVADSVTVTAEVAQVQTSSSAKTRAAAETLPARRHVQTQGALVMTEAPATAVFQSAVRPLPTKLPAATTVARGKLMLATDSAGALFLSENAGQKWKTIKPAWHGKVVSLVALSASDTSSGAAFQLTTDGGETWLSRDGSRWYTAPQK